MEPFNARWAFYKDKEGRRVCAVDDPELVALVRATSPETEHAAWDRTERQRYNQERRFV